MKKIKLLLKRIMIIFAAALILAAGIRMIGAYKHNYLTIYYRAEKSEAAYKPGGNDPFPRKFKDNGESGPYKERIPVHEIDYGEVLWARGVPLITYDYAPEIADSTTVLKKSIKYYEKSRFGYKLAYEIPAGTRVIALPEEGIATLSTFDVFYYAYGLGSFPTYERGWRYASPFKVVGEGESHELGRYGQKYYVKISDLETVMDTVYDEQPFLQYWTEEYNNNEKVFKKWLLTYVDFLLYYSGDYCSPDFYHPYFDTPNIALLSTGGALLIAHIGTRVYLRRKRLGDMLEDSERG